MPDSLAVNGFWSRPARTQVKIHIQFQDRGVVIGAPFSDPGFETQKVQVELLSIISWLFKDEICVLRDLWNLD